MGMIIVLGLPTWAVCYFCRKAAFEKFVEDDEETDPSEDAEEEDSQEDVAKDSKDASEAAAKDASEAVAKYTPEDSSK